MTPDVVALGAWSATSTAPGVADGPDAIDAAAAGWFDAPVPGTAAQALEVAGRWALGQRHDFDAEDWWFRCRFDAPGDGTWDLELEGLATTGDVWLNDNHVLHTDNMFRRYAVEATGLRATGNELVVRCAALSPQLATRRRPRPGWKARMPADQSLRWFRTTLIGRSPAWTPDVAPVGPWRPVSLRRRPAVAVSDIIVTTSHDGTDGVVDVWCTVEPGAHASLVVEGERAAFAIATDEPNRRHARLVVPSASLWWPATHGAQPRYAAAIEATRGDTRATHEIGAVSFRTVEMERTDAPVLRWNGEAIFLRGVCWAPLDIVGLQSDPTVLRHALEQVRDAGMNVVRIQGSFVPETSTFHDLCDELGVLVWHDLMFATLDYPVADEAFQAEVLAEVGELLRSLAHHPSLAVVCGGSEVLQQAAMLGRYGEGTTDLLFEKLLPEQVATHLRDVPYRPGSPTWSGAAFGVDTGVAHYFGVGGYLRPLSDARTSGVRFASESLAFSNVPGDDTILAMRRAGTPVGGPDWKAGVPRDAGRAWDFEDVRDHYVRERFGIDPASVRAVDPDHYLDLGRAAVAEVLGRTLAEWRRPASPCTGAILLQARDLVDGAGFGLVDVHGRPKASWYGIARSLRPIALLAIDEGLSGLDIHAVNDTAEPVAGTLTVKAFSGPNVVADGEVTCAVAPRSAARLRADAVLGGFYDLTYAYRFGPRSIDAVAATWTGDDGVLAHVVFLPDGATPDRVEIGLAATVRRIDDHTSELLDVTTERAARCILVEAPGATASDDAFDLEPGGHARVLLTHDQPVRAGVRAVNAPHPVSAQVIDG